MTGNKIREEFLDFFKQRGHLIQPSAPLSINDPTLLFTIAGMVPLKAFFLGEKKPPASRLASCQLCFRTNDLEKVGETSYHHTFFEMLGNFSLGDYFKKEACQWSWEFVVKELGLRQHRMWVTVFEQDDEAYQIWKKIGIAASRILKKGEEENFWSLGEVGPCGPDTEIFFDRGKKYGCSRMNCLPGCNKCSRWVEIWNLVFMQFNRDKERKLSPLPSKNIDTGMGLERVAFVLQEADSVYDTDLFSPILDWLEGLLPEGEKERKSLKVISDHLRAFTFLLGEGILPSNTGKGYVARRIIRRAYRFGRKLGERDTFLYKGIPLVTKMMEKPYPHLKEKEEEIVLITKAEEENFQTTLNRGMGILETIIQKLKGEGKRLIPHKDVFRLYDSYGFPREITEEIAREDILTGVRVEVDEKKENPFDFALWKKSKENEPSWDSPWGKGRPGWHIECSAMAMRYLGENLDIHGGGKDLIFPHHENEIAQSEGATGKTFVRYWLHNGLVRMKNAKMAKSTDNVLTLSHALSNYKGEVVRYFLLSAHYRSLIDYSQNSLRKAFTSLKRIYNTLRKIEDLEEEYKKGLLENSSTPPVMIKAKASELFNYSKEAEDKLAEALDDDFNVPIALSVIFELARKANLLLNEKKHLDDSSFQILLKAYQKIKALGNILGLLQGKEEKKLEGKEEQLIELLVNARDTLREKKEWELADKIRKGLDKLGIKLEDKEDRTAWRVN